MIELVTDNLSEVIETIDKPILVDFYGTWCGPCKMIEPLIKDISVEYEENLQVIMVDIDENPKSAVAFGVRSIPMLLVFNNGQVMKRHSGAIPKSRIVDLFHNYIV